MIDLGNDVALITGASRGIGAEIAKSFGAAGCKVIVNYHQSKELAENIASSINQTRGQAFPYQADVTDAEQVKLMVEDAVSQLGTPTILVNNASSTIINKKIAKPGWAEFISCFEMAVKSAYNCSVAVTPAMRKQKRGKVINIITQYVHNAPPIAMATYITAKYALVGFSKSLAVELAPFGIHVNMISPGLTETDLTNHLPESVIQAAAQTTPLKRNTQTSDVSNAALYLASNLSDHLTGANLPVCGGNIM